MSSVQLVMFTEPLIDVRGETYGSSNEKSGQFVGRAEDYKIVVILDRFGKVKRIAAESVRFLIDKIEGY